MSVGLYAPLEANLEADGNFLPGGFLVLLVLPTLVLHRVHLALAVRGDELGDAQLEFLERE